MSTTTNTCRTGIRPPPRSDQRQQRLRALPPDLLTDEQKSLAADMKEGIAGSFQGFVNVAAMTAPYQVML